MSGTTYQVSAITTRRDGVLTGRVAVCHWSRMSRARADDMNAQIAEIEGVPDTVRVEHVGHGKYVLTGPNDQVVPLRNSLRWGAVVTF